MNFSLAKTSFLNILLTAFSFFIVIGVFLSQMMNSSYEEKVIKLEKDYISSNKQLVKDQVQNVVNWIHTIEATEYENQKKSLMERVDFVYNVLSSSKNKNLSKTQLINKYKEQLNHFKWDNESGYFYIFDNKGMTLFHGGDKSFENKNIFTLFPREKSLHDFLNEAMTRKTYYGDYSWINPVARDKKTHKKYVFIKKLEKHNIYIAAGMYKEELDKKVQKTVLKKVESLRFGKNDYGYFWIHDLNEVIIMHPIAKNLVGKDLSSFVTLDGQVFFSNATNLVKKYGSGFIDYKWHRPQDNIIDEKTSYVKLIKDWDMVIGSGFYQNELTSLLESEKEVIKKSFYKNLYKVYFALTVLMLLSLVFAWYTSKRIRRVEVSQKEHANMLEQYKSILDSSSLVSKTDTRGKINYINKAFEETTMYSKDEILGRHHNIVRHPETPKNQFKLLWSTIKAGKTWKGIIKNKRKNGDSYYNQTTIVPIKNSEGKIVEYISAATDITELIENRTKLNNVFKTDPLTGLGNRVGLIDYISEHNKGTLCLINIDRFKEINDSYGHEIGDLVIKELSNRLFKYVDDSCKLYRVQGDVFALFFKHKKEEELSLYINSFMKDIGKKPYIIKDKKILLSYTAGIASCDDENLLTYTDMALSEAKNKKIPIQVYETSMNNIKEFRQNLIWVEKLNLAISEDRVVPYFQPIYNYHTHKIEKYECLMRLLENDKVIPPGEYLDVAKKTKLYSELTYKMVGKAISKFATCEEEFSINLSIEDLMNEELMIFLFDYAKQKNIFERMVLEIVESEEIEDSDAVSKTIKRFKDQGSKVAIDDFGSGYSNYDYLISLQADYVKIDGSIINHLLTDERTQEVVKSIVSFAKKSNMKTIAEFVSSEELDKKVKELGVDYAQGFYYGKAESELLGK